MAKPCTVCNHPSRLAIEQAILNGKTLSAVATSFGFVYVSKRGTPDETEKPDHKIIQRHRDNCMAHAYATAMAEREQESGAAIAARLRYLDEQVDTVIQATLKGEPIMVGDVALLHDDGTMVMRHDFRLLLRAVGEGRRNMDLLARLAGKTDTDPADLDAIRAHLESPRARALLAELERLAMEEADRTPTGD
jgi:hypothetical protein